MANANDRPPPFNEEAERSVLGSILIDGSAIWRVSGWLQPDHFYDPKLQAVYKCLLSMAEAHTEIDLLTARDAIMATTPDARPLVVLMSSLVDGIPDTANVERYASIVKRDSDRRRAIGMCEAGGQAFWTGHDVKGSAALVLDSMVDLLDGSDKAHTESARALTMQAMRDLEAKMSGEAVPLGIPTGYLSLDSKTHGFPRGAVTIVGAPPKTGKTTFVLNCALNAAEAGYNVLLFSIDMPKLFVRDRLLSIASGVDSEFVKTGRTVQVGLYGGLSRDELLRMIMSGAERINSLSGSLDINDTSTDLAEIMAECTVRAKMGKLDLVFVDFVQQVESSALRTDSEHRRITTVANKLKNLARKLDIAVVLAAQPNRTLLRGEKMTLRHLAESSSLEQIPRVAFMLHRPGANTGAEELACDLTVLIEKNEGATGEIPLHAELHCYRITERMHGHDCPFDRSNA